MLRKGAAYRKGVAHHRPLRLSEQAENFAQVMKETGEDEPARLSVGSQRFGGLQQMLYLGEVGVGIAVVNEGVQILHRLPHAHRALVAGRKLAFLFLDELERLVTMVKPIEL